MKGPKEYDPLSVALQPASDETNAERVVRESREREAKLVSDAIDADLEVERRRKKHDSTTKVLLLGQSESGKSTTLKQFQLIFAKREFQNERMSWKLIVQLNLVRSIRIILEQLNSLTTTKPIPFEDGKPSRTIHPLSPLNNSPKMNNNASSSSLAMSSQSSGMSSDSDLPSTNASTHSPSRTSHPRSISINSPITPTQQRSPTTPFTGLLPPPLITSTTEMPKLSDHHRTLKMRLLPLVHLESSILRRLNPDDEEATQRGANWDPTGGETFVRSTNNWKEKMSRLRHRSFGADSQQSQGVHDTYSEEEYIDFDNPEDPNSVIQACKDDMISLWNDRVVREVLRMGNVRLEETPGFFLDDIERIASPGYKPSDDDILRARLKTVGVSEYHFQVTMLGQRSMWTFYDVGGARTQRPAWQPYFTDINALIFLAPIGAFDQALTEDRRVNRLEDSLMLFKAISKSELLKNVNFVLFLNKVDILQAKLQNGIKVSRWVKSYGERPNEFEAVSKFFRSKFVAVYREYTPKTSNRMFYVHTTKVTDTKAMQGILHSVCDSIFRANLQSSDLA